MLTKIWERLVVVKRGLLGQATIYNVHFRFDKGCKVTIDKAITMLRCRITERSSDETNMENKEGEP